MDKDVVFSELYHHIFRRRNYPRWRDVPIIKMPTDLVLYAQAIQECKPDLIIETGTKFGGSAMFFGDMLSLFGDGRVITVDIAAAATPPHPRVTYITGRSTSSEVLERLAAEVVGKRVMVVLDSLHSRRHVKRELVNYGRFVTPGQYMVVEDCYSAQALKYGPGEAVDWFLPRSREFTRVPAESQFITGVTRDGWLLRRG